MYRRLIGMGLLAAALLSLPALNTYAQNKKPNGKGANLGEAIDGAKLGVNDVVGKIRTTPGSDRHFSLEVDVPQAAQATQNNRNVNRIAQLQVQLQQAQARVASARTPQQQQQAARQLQNVQRQIAQTANTVNRSAGNVKTTKKEIDFQASENVKVRTLVMPDQFDEKGNFKKHSSEELAKLRGKDKGLPGFESSLEKVTAGQKVKVTLAAAPAKAAGKDKEDDKLVPDKKRQVKLIVILEEGSGEPPAKKPGKKK